MPQVVKETFVASELHCTPLFFFPKDVYGRECWGLGLCPAVINTCATAIGTAARSRTSSLPRSETLFFPYLQQHRCVVMFLVCHRCERSSSRPCEFPPRSEEHTSKLQSLRHL